MGPDARRRSPGLGNHAQRQKLGQHPGVELVRLLRALGNDTQFFGMGKHHAIGHGLDESYKPFVVGGRLDDRLKRPQLGKEAFDPRLIRTGEPSLTDDSTLTFLLDHHTNRDTMLVEVDADVVHGLAPSVETGLWSNTTNRFTTYAKESLLATRPPFSHSFTCKRELVLPRKTYG